MPLTALRKLGNKLQIGAALIADAARGPTWCLEGKERTSGTALRVLYAGEEVHKNYFANLIYEEGHQSEYLGASTPLALRRLSLSNERNAALMVIEGHPFRRWLYTTEDDLWVPRWLDFVADIPLVATNRSAKEDLRRIRKNALTYSVTTDKARLAAFYHSMYVPTVTARHQDRAVKMSFEQMMARLEERACELVEVEKQGEAIAGVLILHEDRRPRLWSNGILNGDPIHWKDRAIPASYLFASEYLAQKGFDSMHMGSTRAFLADGVMTYKTKWKVRAHVEALRGFLLKPLTPSPALDSFFVANPLVALRNLEPRAAIFIDAGQRFSLADRAALEHEYSLDGLGGVDFYRVGMGTRGGPLMLRDES